VTALFAHPFVDRALARRLELASAWRAVHYAEAYQQLHPEARCASRPVAGGYAAFISASSPVNKTAGLGLDGPVTPGDLEALVDFYSSRGAQPTIDVCPLAGPALFDLLHAAGFLLDGFFSVLARALPEGLQPALPPEGLIVARALPEEADGWLQIVGQGFEERSPPSAEAIDILGPNFHAPSSAAYFVWLEGRPVAGGGMYHHEGVIELGGASTLPDYRRRGAQRALIETRLSDARALGCDLAMILTRPGSDSQRNAQRAGFWLAYTKVVMVR
jgi:hypothetical protein